MLSRIIIALGVGTTVAGLALAVVCWRDRSDLRFQNYASQEFATAHPERGFEYIVGYTADQSFYWREILTSKEYKLEVLRQIGETPQSRLGLLHAVSAERYLQADPLRKESLYLVADFLKSPDHIPRRKELVDMFGAYARAFVEILKKRGIEAAPSGEVIFRSEDVASWKITAQRHWLEFLLIGCATSLVTMLLFRKQTEPNQSPEPTAPSGRGSS